MTSVVKVQVNNSLNKIQANWTCVEPQYGFKSFQETEKYWQKQSRQTDNKTIDRQDEAEQEEEEDQIQSDKNDETRKIIRRYGINCKSMNK